MAATNRTQQVDLITEINNNGMYYDFHALMNLCLWHIEEYNLIIKPAVNICFPTQTISKIEIDSANKTIKIIVNFYGLYGLDSPLPQSINKLCLQNTPNSNCMRCFLDIFAQRLYKLLFYAWQRHYPLMHQCLQALSGCHDFTTPIHQFSYYQNCQKLIAILRACIPDININVTEFIARWVTLSDQIKLGDHLYTLGQNVLLGTEILDCSRRINIIIGPVTELYLQQMLLTPQILLRLIKLSKQYLAPMYLFSIIVLVEFKQSDQSYLLSGHLQLGWNTILGNAYHSAYKLQLDQSFIDAGIK